MERELARVKVSASRVALAVANEWKDENDRVMPVKQWLEERRLLHVTTLFTYTTKYTKLSIVFVKFLYLVCREKCRN